MVRFLALALLISWPLQILVYSGVAPAAAELPLLALAGLGPSLAAIVLTRGRVLGELALRPPLAPTLLALAGPSALALIAGLCDLALGGPRPFLQLPFWGAVLWPPFGEELGLRVYLYPRLAGRHGRVTGALATGLAWALWHLPSGMGRHPDAVATILFLGGLVILSFPMAWLFERSGRNAWVALAAHAGVNAVVVGHGDSWRATIVHLLVFTLAALAAARALQSRSPALTSE